jgi:hypothetical protein
MLIGAGLFVVGLVLAYWPGLFGWFGRLSGDIRIEEENRYVFIPITSMLVVSVVLTLLVNLFLRK